MNKIIKVTTYVLFSIIGIGLIIFALGFRVNPTDSIPKGLYRLSSSHELKNAFVLLCPDDREIFKIALNRGYFEVGHCPSGSEALMKKVVAVEGDHVDSTISGVSVNGKKLPFSAPKVEDELRQSLPGWNAFNYVLKKNELVTMTTQSEWSFDSRYYGLINLGQIKGVVTPIWVKKGVQA
mgnify:CR=1 FL=1|tara:strand:+ start:841 stop:1380 length:540 start_codon:yes stop_codon:yes gene_type:complete